eukprot:ctg_1656.g507
MRGSASAGSVCAGDAGAKVAALREELGARGRAARRAAGRGLCTEIPSARNACGGEDADRCAHGSVRPVLKHGPRSPPRVRVFGSSIPGCATKVEGAAGRPSCESARRRADAAAAGHELKSEWTAREHARWDPKDGELCLSRVKPEETLVEARSDSDLVPSEVSLRIAGAGGVTVLPGKANDSGRRGAGLLELVSNSQWVRRVRCSTAGRWPWKSEPAKECRATESSPPRQAGVAAACRRAWGSVRKRGRELRGTGPSADLGGSSNDSSENLEGRSGEGFHANIDWAWVSRS